MILSTNNILKFYFNRTIEVIFTLRTDFLTFNEITDRNEFWKYMETDFLDTAHSFLLKWPNKSVPVDFTVNNENFVLGPPRIRQIRINPTPCRGNSFHAKHFPECFGPYSAKNEYKADYFKGTKYYTAEEAGSYTNIALISDYHAGGYIENLDFDREVNAKIIQKLKESRWIDQGTRMVIVEMNFFNGNLKFYCEAKYVYLLSTTNFIIILSILKLGH